MQGENTSFGGVCKSLDVRNKNEWVDGWMDGLLG
jgi:hypothetical protein